MRSFVAASKEIKGLTQTKHIANFEEDEGYYWADYRYYFGYSIAENVECRYPDQISSYIAPPPQPIPDPKYLLKLLQTGVASC